MTPDGSFYKLQVSTLSKLSVKHQLKNEHLGHSIILFMLGIFVYIGDTVIYLTSIWSHIPATLNNKTAPSTYYNRT